MSLDDIVNVVITAQSTSPSRPGFGIPLIAAYHTRWTSNLVRSYSKLTEMTDDGFLVTDPAYLCAQMIFSQKVRPPKIKVGRRTNAYTQVMKLVPASTTVGYKYSITVAPAGGVKHTAVYTVLGGDTLANVCTGIASAISALAGGYVTGASAGGGTYVTATAGVGLLNDFSAWDDQITLSDVTADIAGLNAELNAMVVEDGDFYGLLLDSNSDAEIARVSGWAESASLKLFGYNTADDGCYDSVSTTDPFYVAKNSGHARTFGLFSYKRTLSYAAAGWMGNMFPFDPGSSTWKFKTIQGLAVDAMSSGKISAVLAKNASVYTSVAGVSITQDGKTASGDWIDTTQFIDWQTIDIKIRVFTILVNNRKIPFTDLGVDQVKAEILSSLAAGVKAGGLAASPAPDVQAPLVKDVSTSDKAARNLPNVTFTARLAGAIHSVSINGTLSI